MCLCVCAGRAARCGHSSSLDPQCRQEHIFRMVGSAPCVCSFPDVRLSVAAVHISSSPQHAGAGACLFLPSATQKSQTVCNCTASLRLSSDGNHRSDDNLFSLCGSICTYSAAAWPPLKSLPRQEVNVTGDGSANDVSLSLSF